MRSHLLVTLALLFLTRGWASGSAQGQISEFQSELDAGKQAAAQADYAGAVAHFNNANRLRQEKCSECYVWLARINLASEQFEEGLKHVDQALAVAAGDHYPQGHDA